MCFFVVMMLISAKFSFISGRNQAFDESVPSLRVDKEQICANRGNLITLNCILAINATKDVSKNWTLSWWSDDKKLTKNASEIWQDSSHMISSLQLNAIWLGEKSFTCVASDEIEYTLKSTSIVNVTTMVLFDNIAFRFTEKPSLPLLEIYWRPEKEVKSFGNIEYSVKYCSEEMTYSDETPETCPKFYSASSSCSYRDKNVYNLNNTNGFVCMAIIQDSQAYNHYRLYISRKMIGESCEYKSSNEHRIFLKHAQANMVKPNATEIIMVPTSVDSLRVEANVTRQVTLVWSDSPSYHREYKVRHKCSNEKWYSTDLLVQTKLTMTSNSFHNYKPYDLCRFCVVTRQHRRGGLDSEPLCQDIRLHEEPPSSAPRIVCPKNECETTHRMSNLTWTLPPRGDWNGVLTKVIIRYQTAQQKSSDYFPSNSYIEVPITNNTMIRHTLLKNLSANHTYWIQTLACNKEGCSPPGTPFQIKTQPRKVVSSPRDENSSISNTFVALGVTAAILIIAYVSYLIYTCVNTRRNLIVKLDLNISEPSGYDVIMDNITKNEYDMLDISQQPYDISQLDAIHTMKHTFV